MSSLESKIESLLFISNQPFTIRKLAHLIKADVSKVESALTMLTEAYNVEGSGIHIQRAQDKVQMVAAADNAPLIKDFIKEEFTGELSRASLETLTIVAYRGPITRAELEQIRGVNCAIILRHLLIRGLIESSDDKKKLQTTYSVTLDFLKYLGINHQSELPDYQRLNASEVLQKALAEKEHQAS